MNIRYTQPEANQTELSRMVRGARLECERLELQIEATIKRALAMSSLIIAAACSGAPTHEIESVQSVDGITDAGPLVSCGVGGHRESVSFVSYGYYDSADGLIKCNSFLFTTPRSVCIYQTAQYQASTVNFCAALSPSYSCTYSMVYSVGSEYTNAVETDYYTTAAYPNISDWQTSCSTIGGKWSVQ
jgi:hypothetical protein